MSSTLEFTEIESAVSEIRNLMAAKAEAEAMIADCQRDWATAEQMLKSLDSEAKTPENKQYLIAARKAWRASIKAHKSSIVAIHGDIALYKSAIDDILKRVPEARLDN